MPWIQRPKKYACQLGNYLIVSSSWDFYQSAIYHLLFTSLRPDLGQRDKPLGGLNHFLQRGPFQRRMRIVLAAGQIWGGQAQFGQARAVGPAADNGALGSAAESLQGFLGISHGAWFPGETRSE